MATLSSSEVSLPGIGFALSTSDLIHILSRFSPDAAPSPPISAPTGTGTVAIASGPSGADIYVDGKFVGQTPSTIPLTSGSRRIEVKPQGKQAWSRDLEVLKDSQLSLDAALESTP